MSLKEEVYKECVRRTDEKIESLQKILQDLRASAANETKSTAGDKHETALAMLQIEQENTGRQLQDALQQKLLLNRIDIKTRAIKVVNGSLVKTNNGYLFICIAAGKIIIEEHTIIVLSPQSPLGSKLIGSSTNDCISFNNHSYLIETIE